MCAQGRQSTAPPAHPRVATSPQKAIYCRRHPRRGLPSRSRSGDPQRGDSPQGSGAPPGDSQEAFAERPLCAMHRRAGMEPSFSEGETEA